MIRIALIDDQALIRDGIARLIELNPDHQVVWQAEHGQQALERLNAAPEQVDLIISDIRMPVMDGIQFVEQLRAQEHPHAVLMLTTFDEHELFVRALQAGINGFLLKDVTVEKLEEAIVTIAQGGFLAEPELLNRKYLPHNESENATPAAYEKLTDKERQILRYLAAGFSNKEIAAAICLAEGTVKNSISSILTKLHSRDRTQAVIKALRLQLI
ncbi:response regulator transcription factor [Echinimonas agarilytica]|uniref:Response regulator transcription factor n=1 Tax=Echinimonas agarilytica TaxID=1215918 RepID=A0AA41W465_9GAMM|nr:response regulator transcription factor [Echinimonas agarilytica]MCM2678437.1 response regulator transcription factor [Echinimonas agarilytica]